MLAVESTASEVAPSEVAAAPAAQPRLMIQRMVLENFKSYAGKQEIGPFDKNMSSVVGPNGSGKSNVIDSMLFVFGFKSNKMRQSKLSELIHTSEKHPALQYARVAVYFQDIIDREDGGYDVVPGSCLEVSREARRDNSSKYMVNGKTSNFTDVTKLLRQRGADGRVEDVHDDALGEAARKGRQRCARRRARREARRSARLGIALLAPPPPPLVLN